MRREEVDAASTVAGAFSEGTVIDEPKSSRLFKKPGEVLAGLSL